MHVGITIRLFFSKLVHLSRQTIQAYINKHDMANEVHNTNGYIIDHDINSGIQLN